MSYITLGTGDKDQNTNLQPLGAYLLIGKKRRTSPSININTRDGLVGFIGEEITDTNNHYSDCIRLNSGTRKTFISYSTLNQDTILQFIGSLDDQQNSDDSLVNGYKVTNDDNEPTNLIIEANSKWKLVGTLTDLHGFIQAITQCPLAPTSGELILFVVE